MKAFPIVLLAVALTQAAPAPASSSTASPVIGTWAVDVARLALPPAERPKGVTIRFDDAGGGKLATQVDIVDPSGVTRHAEGTVPLDGTPSPVDGHVEADIAAARMPTPDVLVMQLAKGGMPSSTRVYTVAADGDSMVETAAYFGKDGRPILRTNHFTRVR